MAKKLQITDDIRKALAGVALVSGTVEYRLEIDGVPAEMQPVFMLRMLTVDEQQKNTEKLISAGDSKEGLASIALASDELTRSHVMGWKNLVDLGTLEYVDFVADESGGCSKELWQYMPQLIRNEINRHLKSLHGIGRIPQAPSNDAD